MRRRCRARELSPRVDDLMRRYIVTGTRNLRRKPAQTLVGSNGPFFERHPGHGAIEAVVQLTVEARVVHSTDIGFT